ncbi:MAG: hypothetical protein ACREOQ_22500, partial [Gemmatimonadales bacterium]
MLLVIGAMPHRQVQGQAQLHLPFIAASQTLGAPTETLSTVTLKRTCRLILSLTGAKRADVKDWKFSIGDVVMQGPTADDQPTVYVGKIRNDAVDPLRLTLSGAPGAAITSLGTVDLHVTNLIPPEKCSGTGEGGAAGTPPAPRSTMGYPQVYDRSRRMA